MKDWLVVYDEDIDVQALVIKFHSKDFWIFNSKIASVSNHVIKLVNSQKIYLLKRHTRIAKESFRDLSLSGLIYLKNAGALVDPNWECTFSEALMIPLKANPKLITIKVYSSSIYS